MKNILKKQTQQEFFTILTKMPPDKILAITDKGLRKLSKMTFDLDMKLKTFEITLATVTKEEYYQWFKEVLDSVKRIS